MPTASHCLRSVLAGVAAVALVAVPAVAANTPEEEANKQLVLHFYAALNEADATGTMRERIAGIAERYLSPDYIQHAAAFAHLPGPGSARDRLVRFFQDLPPHPPGAPPPTTVAVMAESDRVMMLTSRPAPSGPEPTYIFNMFRILHGRLAEHWDVAPAPPSSPPSAR